MLAKLFYCYDCVFCVLVSVCAKQGLWEDLGESLFDLAENRNVRAHEIFYFKFCVVKFSSFG